MWVLVCQSSTTLCGSQLSSSTLTALCVWQAPPLYVGLSLQDPPVYAMWVLVCQSPTTFCGSRLTSSTLTALCLTSHTTLCGSMLARPTSLCHVSPCLSKPHHFLWVSANKLHPYSFVFDKPHHFVWVYASKTHQFMPCESLFVKATPLFVGLG